MRLLKIIPIMFAGLLLVACGGDDDDSSTDNKVALSSKNAAEVAGEIVGAADTDFSFVAFTKQQIALLERLESQMITSPTLATGAVIAEEKLPCDKKGTFDYSINDTDNNNKLSKGDIFTITFHNCVDNSGERIDGQMSITILEGKPNWSMKFVMTNLTVTDSAGPSTINGDFTMGITTQTTANGTIESISMTATSLTITESGTTLSNYSFKATENSNSLLVKWKQNGTFESSQLNDTVSFVTLQPFEELKTDSFPYAGVMKITGHNNSSVKLIVLDAATVRLEVDENGDGAVDNTLDVAWTSL
ncbi:hypothetical protein PN36_12875 [Candidatus Thiomargarita nelsonii]|uniref:Lipoprotein n=1 Tax=Candidatus Thiomargarita nelsonii TaxID=1003181 RepID=A0A4E0QQ69_9GAMM|nr:hypothetical protein PN36_12875 [Candidatus Thiomargarita nelsonii]